MNDYSTTFVKRLSTALATAAMFFGSYPWEFAIAQTTDKAAQSTMTVSPKLLNEQAASFVNRANQWIKQHALIDTEFKRSIQALDDACAKIAKSRNENADKHAEKYNNRVQISNEFSPNPAAIDTHKQDVSILRVKIGDESRQRCSNLMRAPGLRNDRCLILEMLSQWTIQAEQFIDERSRFETSAQDLIEKISSMENGSCPTGQRLTELRLKMSRMLAKSQVDAERLTRQTMQGIQTAFGEQP